MNVIPADALLTRDQTAAALAAAGFPHQIQDSRHESLARRRAALSVIRAARAVQVE